MTEQNINKELYNTPEYTEEMAALAKSNEQQQELKKEIERNRKYKGIFRRLTFHYNTSNILENWRNIINQLTEKFKDDDSIEWTLFNNPQVKKLLSNIVNSQVQTIEEEKVRCERHLAEMILKGKENDEESRDITLEQYMIDNLQLENFEEFILSDEWIAIIVRELKRHINIETWEFYPNYPINEEILKLKLNNAWNNSLYKEYNIENGIYTSEEKDEVDRIWNVVEDKIDDIVWDYIKNWWKTFDKELINKLESIVSDSWDGESIDELLKNSAYRGVFMDLLKNKIIEFSSLAFKWDKISLTTLNTQINLQLRSYLYMYWKFFYPGLFETNQLNSYYESTLLKVMESILVVDGDKRLKDLVRYNEFLEQEKKLDQERKERDKRRRAEIAKRNKEKNEHLQSSQKINRRENVAKIQAMPSDPNEATWAEIAANADLWKDLDDFNLNIEESNQKEGWIKETAFSDAWKKFIEKHDNMKTIITQEQMRQIFDVDSNNINSNELENFIANNPLLKELSSEQIEKIRSTISKFSSYFDNAEKKLWDDSDEMNEKMGETVKTYAIGAVIDDVRDTFDTINENQTWEFNWFHLDSNIPVKKDWNNLIISGSFNGSEVKVRYNLETGELFMNSFLHKLSPSKISIWMNSLIDYPIWTIKPFNDVLNDYYNLPPRSYNPSIDKKPHDGKSWMEPFDKNQAPQNNEIKPKDNLHLGAKPMWKPFERQAPQMNRWNIGSKRNGTNEALNSQLDLIGKAIKDNTESQAQKNSAITEFMKTFNVVSNSRNFSTLDFNEWSNLFNVIQILDNSDSSNLEYFNNTFMPKMMEYAWLKWGERNEYQNKSSKKSEKIFDYSGDNENIKYLRDKTKDFNPEQFSWVANFESSHQLWFADLIEEKITLWSKPNRKLDITKMEGFIRSIENKYDENPDNILEKKLINI